MGFISKHDGQLLILFLLHHFSKIKCGSEKHVSRINIFLERSPENINENIIRIFKSKPAVGKTFVLPS